MFVSKYQRPVHVYTGNTRRYAAYYYLFVDNTCFYLQEEGVAQAEELDETVGTWNSQLSSELGQIDSVTPKVS